METKKKSKKLQISLPQRVLDELRRESEKTGASMAAIIKIRIAAGKKE